MASKRFRLIYHFLFFLALAACSPAPPPSTQTLYDYDILYQTSTLSALNAGDFDGEMWAMTLLEFGNFGLGTFNALDGEMVILDNVIYQIREDGTVSVVENGVQTPFAVVTHFGVDHTHVFSNAGVCADIQTQIDSQLPQLDMPYAIKIHGEFTYLKVRAPRKQSAPYPTLADALVDQVVFESQNITGTMVGFRLPDYLAGANATGYHFHFISDDREHGGHVMDCRAETLLVHVDQTERIYIDVTSPTVDPMQNALQVGALLPLSGPYETLGYEMLNAGHMVAIGAVNDNGGINGRMLELVRVDTLDADIVGAGAAAARAFIDAGVLALVGPISPDFAEVMPLINEHAIPMISPSAGTVALDRAGEDNFYRTVPSDALGGRALALAVAGGADYLGEAFANVVLMMTDAPAYRSFQAPIEHGFADAGHTLAATVVLAPGAESYASGMEEALAHAPDLIILVADPTDSIAVMREAIDMGYAGKWFLTQDQSTADFIRQSDVEIGAISGALLEGSFGLLEVNAPTSSVELDIFTRTYSQTFGYAPPPFATNTHDAVTVLALAILRADIHGKLTRESVNASLPLVANPGTEKTMVTNFLQGKTALMAGGEINYQGISGPIDFDDYGNVVQPYGIFQVQNGAWVQIATVESDPLQALLEADE